MEGLCNAVSHSSNSIFLLFEMRNMCVYFLLIISSLFAPFKTNPHCDPCPASQDYGCTCQLDGIICSGQYAIYFNEFPTFQPTEATCNTSIYIHGYYFKGIPSNAFFLGQNVTVYRLKIADNQNCNTIRHAAFSGLGLQQLILQNVPKLKTLLPNAFYGLSAHQLEITSTHLLEFPTKALQKAKGLSALSITHSYISTLQPGTFEELSELVYLNLDNNAIGSVTGNVFRHLPNLNCLHLAANFISTVDNETFAGLTSLSDLFLEGNELTTVAPDAFSGIILPNLQRLRLDFGRSTRVQPGSFHILPNLLELSISIENGNLLLEECVKAFSLNCSDIPNIEQLFLNGAACTDIFRPLDECIKSLDLSIKDYEHEQPLCLHQLESLTNLQKLTLGNNIVSIISFNINSLKHLSSLYVSQDSHICDDALYSTPHLTELVFSSSFYSKRHYIPKAVQQMQHLKKLSTSDRGDITIICNCSSFWLYNFTISHGIDTSTWKCKDKYGYNVKQFLADMASQRKCTGKQPDFSEWEQRSCSQLCLSDEKTTKTPETRNSTVGNTLTSKGTATSTQPISTPRITQSSLANPTSTTSAMGPFQDKKKSETKILYSALGSLSLVLLICGGVGYYWYKRYRRVRHIKIVRLALESHDEQGVMWEVGRKSLQLFDEKLGSGAFGIVVKGKLLHTAPSANSRPKIVHDTGDRGSVVAVKMLPSHADSTAKSQFLREIETMQHLGHHPHLVSIIACITMSEPVCLIVEFCSDGDLLRYLRARRPNPQKPDLKPLSVKDLLSFAWQVADGMSFLSSKRYAHRDLAARNILIHNSNIVKISDFGLCCQTDENTASYVGKGGRLPLRWLAPECIQDFKFSVASDVWAFGVFLFEVISLGATPYEDLHLSEIQLFLAEGKRLSQTHGCPDNLYQMMLQCWQQLPEERPCFPEIKTELFDMLEKETEKNQYYLTVCCEVIDTQ